MIFPFKIKTIDTRNINDRRFSTIIYVSNTYNDIIIEDVANHQFFSVPSHELGNYINIDQAMSNWRQVSNTQFVRFSQDAVQEFVKFDIPDPYPFFDFRWSFSLKANISYEIPEIDLEHFKVWTEPSPDSTRLLYNISARLPIFNLWGLFNIWSNKKTFSGACVVINNRIYMYPYGNTHRDGSMCTGFNFQFDVDNLQSVYNFIISSPSNGDLGYKLRCNRLKQGNSKFDIAYIKELIDTNKNEEQLGLVECLYFLSMSYVDRDLIPLAERLLIASDLMSNQELKWGIR